MTGDTVAEVVEARNAEYKIGDTVVGRGTG
jgi:NADPH-dependent curcumin reductase CurA